MFTDTDDTIEIDGFDLSIRLLPDDGMGPPWEAHDGHGPVTDWTDRDKLPGELILSTDGRYRRYYDIAAATRTARADGWGCERGQLEGESAGAYAYRAARADFDRLKAWCDDQWGWIGVVVVVKRQGVELGRAGLWGIEDDAGGYLVEVANNLIDEAMDEARAKLAALSA